ncbi:MAG TPA: hypothetical protein VJ103_01890 [Candidatus Paceibacterota bacterium]|nr:hypothetical protein [Candidatus Paceibacterota bacterium]
MKKKSPKKINKTYTQKELGHHLGSLQEYYVENLKAIREGFGVINNKLDSHSKILDSHSKILASHTEMIGHIMEDITVIKSNVSLLKSDLKKKVDYDDFSSLEKRVASLESRR